MKKQLRVIGSAGLALVFALSSLSGCGNQDADGTGSSLTEKETCMTETVDVSETTQVPSGETQPTIEDSADELDDSYWLLGTGRKEVKVEVSNGYIVTMKLFASGSYYTFHCKNVVLTEDDKIQINPGGCIFTETPLPEMTEFRFLGLECAGTINFWTYDRYSQYVETLDSINFYPDPITCTVAEGLAGVKLDREVTYFKLDSDETITFDEFGFKMTGNSEKMYELGDYFEAYVSLDNATDIQLSGNQLQSFTCSYGEGEEVTFICEGITVDDENRMFFSEKACVFSANPMHAVLGVSFTGLSDDTEEGWICCSGGYDTVVEQPTSCEDVLWGLGQAIDAWSGDGGVELRGCPRYLSIKSDPGTFALKGFTLKLSKEEPREEIPFREVSFWQEFYGYYTEGQFYDTTKEVFSLDEYIFTFYLVMKPQDVGATRMNGDVYGTEYFTVGNLYDKDGNVKDKVTDPLAVGDALDITVGQYTYRVELPVYPRNNESELKQMLHCAAYQPKGDLNVLVVPYYFEESGYQESDLDVLRSVLGNVSDAEGNLTTYTIENGRPTFSSYFATASYDQLHITSYITEPYQMSGSYAEMRDYLMESEDIEQIQTWLSNTSAELIPICDADEDGYFDAVILYCISDGNEYMSFSPLSHCGAYCQKQYYSYEGVRENNTVIGTYLVIGEEQVVLDDGLDANSIIHEFGHGLGLVDYYDVYYAGINAVGGFDMQSDNVGDWNPYSKNAVGWATPTIVTLNDVEAQGSVDYTIHSFATTGESLLIPTTANMDGLASVFDEYIMVDLFTPEGLNTLDANHYGMENARGVRMYHVDAIMASIPEENKITGEKFNVGGICYTNAYNKSAQYLIELLQRGGVNTLTAEPNLGINRTVNSSDLFQVGDVFTMEAYHEFFYQNRMDNGTEFPYKITVKSIDGDTAVINIAK